MQPVVPFFRHTYADVYPSPPPFPFLSEPFISIDYTPPSFFKYFCSIFFGDGCCTSDHNIRQHYPPTMPDHIIRQNVRTNNIHYTLLYGTIPFLRVASNCRHGQTPTPSQSSHCTPISPYLLHSINDPLFDCRPVVF